jgi:Tol biopolymer transport system component/predicted Ser/Thr protein kinase
LIPEKLAHYEVAALLGSGGMGEVYRARDTKLGRDVAIKILPAELSKDPERAARFDREARTLASLQHPNIASIYGYETVDGIRFLVMELVEGQNLSERIARGPMAIEEAKHIALQITMGLEAAHDRGIVHRDLKPANIMLTPAGDAKILDFGLARAWYGDTGDSNPSNSPTITTAMTQAGAILGTAAYMSPEQARGGNVDRRADIWAFGAILWEMVTGKRLFEGETISDTLAAVLRDKPDWSELPVDEAPELCRIVERCLMRDPRQRLRDIGEARILLQGGASTGTALPLSSASMPAATGQPATRTGIRWPLLAIVAVAMLAVGAVAGGKLFSRAPGPQALHLMVPPPPGLQFDMNGASPGPAALSPDGTMLAFSAMGTNNDTHLYLRQWDRSESVMLPGTEDASYPFWSPDGKFIAFFSANDNKLRKVAIAGGPSVTICPSDNGKGGSWNQDGTIIFSPGPRTPLHRVASIGGDSEAITELGTGEDSHRHPRFLPGGRDFLFLKRKDSNKFSVWKGSLDGREPEEIAATDCQAEYVSGYLFTGRDGILFATPFDPGTGKLTGGGIPVVEKLLIAGSGAGAGSYSVLPSGMMTFQTGSVAADRVLSIGDLETGNSTEVGTSGQIYYPSVSPDGRSCVVEVYDESNEGGDLWLVDLESGLRNRFTFDEGDETRARWAPDGSAVVFSASGGKRHRIIKRSVEGAGSGEVLRESDRPINVSQVSPDNSGILFTSDAEDTTVSAVMFLPFDGGDPTELVSGEDVYGGAYSSNGRWLLFGGKSVNGVDVFVMPAAGGPRRWQVTTNGAGWAQWSGDGARIAVIEYSGTVSAYDTETAGDTFRSGKRQEMMRVEIPDGDGWGFSLYPDGRRILFAGPDPRSAQNDISPINLVTNWHTTLTR